MYKDVISTYSTKCINTPNEEGSILAKYSDFGKGYVIIHTSNFLYNNCDHKKGYFSQTLHVYFPQIERKLEDEVKPVNINKIVLKMPNEVLSEFQTNSKEFSQDFGAFPNCGSLKDDETPFLLTNECLSKDFKETFKSNMMQNKFHNIYISYNKNKDALVLNPYSNKEFCPSNLDIQSLCFNLYREE